MQCKCCDDECACAMEQHITALEFLLDTRTVSVSIIVVMLISLVLLIQTTFSFKLSSTLCNFLAHKDSFTSINFMNLHLSLQGLETYQQSPVKLRPKEQLSVPKSERINSYRFSMANLEETQESELDSILTELSLLEQKSGDLRQGRTQTHSRSSSIVSGANSTISSTATSTDIRESSRTESPDNDSAFSDTVSLLSSESSASSGLSSLNNVNKISTPAINVVQVR